MSSGLLRLLEVVGLGGRDNVGKSLVVLGSDGVDGNNGRGLLAGDQTKSGLALDNDVSCMSECHNMGNAFTHGTPIFRQRAGKKTTNSIGSTSSAMTTN